MRRVAAAAMLVAAAGLIGFNSPAGAEDATAVMVDNAYRTGTCESNASGGSFQVSQGDTITWTNCGMNTHTVTGAFGDSGDLAQSASYAYTFTEPGTFAYYCKYHRFAGMSGTVTVGAAATTTTQATVPPTTATTATTARTTTTRQAATTTSSPSTTTTIDDIGGVFDPDSTPSTTETTVFSTGTTRALGSGGDDNTSAGLVALLIVGLGAVGTAGALLVRRMRGGDGMVGPS